MQIEKEFRSHENYLFFDRWLELGIGQASRRSGERVMESPMIASLLRSIGVSQSPSHEEIKECVLQRAAEWLRYSIFCTDHETIKMGENPTEAEVREAFVQWTLARDPSFTTERGGKFFNFWPDEADHFISWLISHDLGPKLKHRGHEPHLKVLLMGAAWATGARLGDAELFIGDGDRSGFQTGSKCFEFASAGLKPVQTTILAAILRSLGFRLDFASKFETLEEVVIRLIELLAPPGSVHGQITVRDELRCRVLELAIPAELTSEEAEPDHQTPMDS